MIILKKVQLLLLLLLSSGLFLASCNSKSSEGMESNKYEESGYTNNKKLNENRLVNTYNIIADKYAQVKYAKQWSRWILVNDLPYTEFDSYQEYVNEIRTEVDVNDDLNKLKIVNSGTGGGEEVSEFFEITDNQDSSYFLLIKRSVSPESIESKYSIFLKTKDEIAKKATDKNGTLENELSLFFPKDADLSFLIDHNAVYIDYQYHSKEKKLVKQPKTNYLFDCNSDKTNTTIDETIKTKVCEILSKQIHDEVAYRWDKTKHNFQ